MRYLVLSDIHSNVDALDAVLEAAPPSIYDRVLVLGDLVGYGAEPNLVVERVRALAPVAIVRGNHDKVATGLESAEEFNPVARQAAEWTARALSEDVRAYLRAIPRGPLVVDDDIEICNGSPADEDAYVFGDFDAAEALAAARRPVCLFGHTHVAMAAVTTADRLPDVVSDGSDEDGPLNLAAGCRYLANPGSVGQPRDGDPRAAFALVDTACRQIRFGRVEYPAARAGERILKAGLPGILARRLLVGR